MPRSNQLFGTSTGNASSTHVGVFGLVFGFLDFLSDIHLIGKFQKVPESNQLFGTSTGNAPSTHVGEFGLVFGFSGVLSHSHLM